MMFNDLDSVTDALAGLTATPVAGLTDRIFGSWLAAPSRLGATFVAFTGAGVQFVRSAESVHGDAAAFAEAYRDRFGRPLRPAGRAPAGLLVALAGRPTPVRLDLRGLSDFERDVLTATSRIPVGQIRPYGWVAREAGCPRAVRAVGSVLARNPVPLLIPCHRVVRADGLLGDYMFGSTHKEQLLRAEQMNVDEVAALARRGCTSWAATPPAWSASPPARPPAGSPPPTATASAPSAAALAAGYRPCHHCRPTGPLPQRPPPTPGAVGD